MATKTTNLELTKPDLDDSIEVSVFNENFDIIDAAVAEKVGKVEGMGLSQNSFTDAEKSKLSGLENYDDSAIMADINNITNQIFDVGVTIPSNANLNDYTTAGIYKSASAAVTQTIGNTPYKTGGFRLVVSCTTSTENCTQIMYPNSSALGCFFTRVITGGTVGQWFKHQGEVVTT